MFAKFAFCAAVLVASVANAQVTTVSSFDPSNAVDPISNVQGRGIKVGEGTVLHPVIGLETGVVSNVFYEEDNTKPAGILRLLLQVGTASLSGDRLNPNAPNVDPINPATGPDEGTVDLGSFQYQANIRVAYDQPLSANEDVRETGGLGVGARFRGMVAPMNKWSFGFDENFMRLIRASNFETATNENRDINTLRLSLVYHPRGRNVHGYLFYENKIDIFESDQSEQLYPDRIDHRFGIRPTWQWLPKTQVFGEFSIGIVDGLGSAPASEAKVQSSPLLARAGFSTLLTAKTALNASAGYTAGFYSTGPSYSAPFGDVAMTYRYSPLGRVGVKYQYLHQDSVNANYFRDHVVGAQLQQDFVPFTLLVQPEARFRRYEGVNIMSAPPTRDDVIFYLIAGMNYNFRNWIAAAVEYKFSTVQTDFSYIDAGGQTVFLDYVRHEFLAGLRVAM